MERDPDSPMYDQEIRGNWSHPDHRGRRHDRAPHAPVPPLPAMDMKTVKGIEALGKYLTRSHQLRRDIAHLQTGVENAQYGIKAVLIDHPQLRRVYDAFVASGAGETADDWRAFASAYKNPAKRSLKLVIDNSPPPKRKRVRIGEHGG
ncbi:hypothetical protein [Pseudorhodoplanes sp.]|uniref:hypothetical protein n=1 Tax=Pseudorhodoplanes sp. TaxID=1934341 RepID=UPI003D0C0543